MPVTCWRCTHQIVDWCQLALRCLFDDCLRDTVLGYFYRSFQIFVHAFIVLIIVPSQTHHWKSRRLRRYELAINFVSYQLASRRRHHHRRREFPVMPLGSIAVKMCVCSHIVIVRSLAYTNTARFKFVSHVFGCHQHFRLCLVRCHTKICWIPFSGPSAACI
jgi:hypothetical protein